MIYLSALNFMKKFCLPSIVRASTSVALDTSRSVIDIFESRLVNASENADSREILPLAISFFFLH